MNKLRIIIVVSYLVLLSHVSMAQPKFSLNKYMGLWYEIASMPNRFQKKCYNTTAEYTVNFKGNVDVKNTYRDEKGKIKKDIKGEAVVKDLDKKLLKVFFFRPAGLNIFGGDYQILALDPDYKWAFVGGPSKKIWMDFI
jgi:apolipoprotein D and lipocalin family protein